MNSAIEELSRLIDTFTGRDGFHSTPVSGTYCIKVSKPARRTNDRWRASLSLVAQGAKEIVLGGKNYRTTPGQYVATPIQLPVISRVAAASSATPFLCLLIDLDPVILSEVSAGVPRDSSLKESNSVRAMFSSDATARMLDAAIRLVRVFATAEDATVLGPLIVKELLYLLMKGPEGAAIWQYVRAGSAMHKVSQAIHLLQSELDKDVDVDALAKAATMSRSAFFEHFKEITAMSPIQYQKRLRLHEARRLMLELGHSAERSSFEVGYRSPSQFSREYARMFGIPPGRDTNRVKSQGQAVVSST